MINWKDYVGLQIVPEGDSTGECWFLIMHINDDKHMSIVHDHIAFNCHQILTETAVTIGGKVEAALRSFPEIEIHNVFELHAAQNRVAFNTRRAQATTNWENVWYYKNKGTIHNSSEPSPGSLVDQPLFVMQQGDKYGIIKHPNFDKYGFVMKE